MIELKLICQCSKVDKRTRYVSNMNEKNQQELIRFLHFDQSVNGFDIYFDWMKRKFFSLLNSSGCISFNVASLTNSMTCTGERALMNINECSTQTVLFRNKFDISCKKTANFLFFQMFALSKFPSIIGRNLRMIGFSQLSECSEIANINLNISTFHLVWFIKCRSLGQSLKQKKNAKEWNRRERKTTRWTIELERVKTLNDCNETMENIDKSIE